MVNFSLSEEEKGIRRMLNEFAVKEIRPRAAAVDKDPEHRFDWEIVRKAARLNILGMPVPEAYGGAGLPLFSLAIATEELAYGDAGISSCIGMNWLNEIMIILEGNQYNYERYLPMLSAQEGNLSANAVTEPMAGSDAWTYRRYLPGALRTIARKDGSDYVINGVKAHVTNGGLADLYLALASLDPNGGRDASAYFYVPGDAPGVSVGMVEDKMGQRVLQNAEVIFTDVRVPAENLYGEEGKGLWYVENIHHSLSGGAVGASSIGIARAAYDEALAYAKERVQGGKPIIEHQSVSFKLADMSTLIEAGRTLAWKAIWANIQNLGGEPRLSRMARVFCTEAAVKVTLEAIQLFGGYGFIKDCLIEKLLRDAALNLCPNDINRLDLAENLS
ncbi:MAG: acyl-CoA dehydrogenase family protein [Actinobacteria bacterium]|nr:acyl-CoA dehydrogenase family protein [Actinomycetota bacterium]